MSQTLTPRARKNRTLFHSNPVLSRLSRAEERDVSNAATYAGIAAKASYFLLVTLAGMLAQLLVKGMMASEPVWQTIRIYKNFTLTLTAKEGVILLAVLGVGLAFTVIWIYLKILDLLMQFAGNKDN